MKILIGRSTIATVLLLAVCTRLLAAGTAGTGTITGRILNPSTGEYVHSAEVHVEGTDLVALSEAGGFYTLSNVPAGAVTLTLNYTGYTAERATVMVAAGGTTARDFTLTSTEYRSKAEGEAIKMGEFVVSTEREGNAKAIMEQRRHMNISSVVASDAFGDVAEGNLGEFVKFLPGVDIEYNGMEARSPRIQGMDPQYAAVTMNGMRLASGDAYINYLGTSNVDAGEGSRMFNFAEVSLNSLESVEVFKTNSADMDADAPAGTINLKTKRAFDRKGRRLNWQLSAMLNSTAFNLKKTYGPDDEKHYKARPGAVFGYSDAFLHNRLGIAFNISQSNMFAPEQRIEPLQQTTPTATDPRPIVITKISFLDNPRFTQRFASTLTTDFKATPNLVLSLYTSYNATNTHSANRTLAFTFGANTTAAAGRGSVLGDGVTTLQTSAAGGASRALSISGARGFVKLGNSVSIFPRFEYKKGPLTADGQAGYSRSISAVRGIEEGAAAYTRMSAMTAFDFKAVRSSPTSADWKITQLSGLDWTDLSNHRNPVLADEHRDGRDQIFTGEANARLDLPWRVPTWLKTGAKIQQRVRDYQDQSVLSTWAYVGPGGGPTGSFAAYPSPTLIDMSHMGPEFFGVTSGLPPTIPNRQTLTDAFHAHPEYFVNSSNATNWLDANVRNSKDFKEQINAAYVLGYTKVSGFKIQTGVRWEETVTASKEFDPLPASQVRAAGFPVTGATATTIPGMIYQFTSQPRVIRSASYDNFFPTFSAKYDFRPNLIGHFGYNQSIQRPSFNHISGLWLIDEINQRVTVPNPGLLPENSEKYMAQLEYYFEPVGHFSVGGFISRFQHLREAHEFTAEEFGRGDDPLYSNYTFVTETSGVGTKTFKGLELDYRQQLAFLPGLLKGTGIFADYTRTLSDARRPGLAPHQIKAGVNFRYRRLTFAVNAVWYPDTPTTTTDDRYRLEQTKYDASGSILLTDRISFFFQGRNITNVADNIVTRTPGLPQLEFRYAEYGAMWTFGLKGSF